MLCSGPTVWGCSASDSTETVTLLWNRGGERMLQDFWRYDPKRKVEMYVKGTMMSIARLDISMTTVVYNLLEKEMRERRHQEEYTDTNGKMVETDMKQHIGNVSEFKKHWSWEEVPVEKYTLGREERREAVMEMSRKVSNLWASPSVRKTFILLKERWFRAYLTDVLESVNYSYVEQVLDGDHIDPLGMPTEGYKPSEVVEKGRIVVSSKDDEVCIEALCYDYFDPLQM